MGRTDGDDGFNRKTNWTSGAITGLGAAVAVVVVTAAVSCRYYSWWDCRPNCACSPATSSWAGLSSW